MMRLHDKKIALVLLILLLAAGSRIMGIDAQSLWIDEGFTWHLTQYHDPLRILQQDVHPPLYFFAVTLWVRLTGTSDVAMRFFSVLPSLLSVAVMFRLAREVEMQRGINSMGVIPLMAALLLALADAENYLAKEMRSYTWHVLFASVSMWGFLAWVRTTSRRWLALWMLSTIAVVYTFYLGAFVGVVQGLYALLFINTPSPPTHKGLIAYFNRQRMMAIGILVLCALSLLPWLLFTGGEQTGNISYAEWIRPDAFLFWLGDFRTRYFGNQWALMLGLFMLGLVMVSYSEHRIKVRWGNIAPMILLLMWFGVPLLLVLLLNERVPTYQPRRVTQIVPAIALLTAFGLWNVQRYARWFLLGVIVVYSMSSVDYWRYKQEWREMAQATVPYIQGGSSLLFDLEGDDYAPRYHYLRELDNGYDTFLEQSLPMNPHEVVSVVGLTTWRHLEPETYEGGLPAYINTLSHVWLFYWSADTGAMDWMREFGFVRTATFTVDFNPSVRLFRYDRLPDAPIAVYENGLTLRNALLHDDGLVELFWSMDHAIREDYTVSVVLLDASGQVVAQVDSQPFLGERPTSTWDVGEVVYDPKLPITTSDSIIVGTYDVALTVYESGSDGDARLLSQDGIEHIMIGSIVIP